MTQTFHKTLFCFTLKKSKYCQCKNIVVASHVNATCVFLYHNIADLRNLCCNGVERFVVLIEELLYSALVENVSVQITFRHLRSSSGDGGQFTPAGAQVLKASNRFL